MHFKVFFFAIDPIALRKAKIVHSCGLSKCNRAELQIRRSNRDNSGIISHISP